MCFTIWIPTLIVIAIVYPAPATNNWRAQETLFGRNINDQYVKRKFGRIGMRLSYQNSPSATNVRSARQAKKKSDNIASHMNSTPGVRLKSQRGKAPLVSKSSISFCTGSSCFNKQSSAVDQQKVDMLNLHCTRGHRSLIVWTVCNISTPKQHCKLLVCMILESRWFLTGDNSEFLMK